MVRIHDYEIGVITSALGTNNPYEAVAKIKELGIPLYQLAWLPNFVKEKGGMAQAIDSLRDLSLQKEPRLHSICIAHSAESSINDWIDNAMGYIRLASALGLYLATEHIQTITPENKGVILPALREIVGYGQGHPLIYALETGNESLDTMLSVAEEVPGLRFCFDPGNFLHIGLSNGQILNYVRDLQGLIIQVHIKDARKGEFTALGQGDLDLGRFLRALDKIGYKGPLILEDSRQPVGVRLQGVAAGKSVLERTIHSLGTR